MIVSCFDITEEFVAHGSNVNCLALGPKSGRVMVTGGDDRKVNMWAVGKPNCIMVSYFIPFLQSLFSFKSFFPEGVHSGS